MDDDYDNIFEHDGTIEIIDSTDGTNYLQVDVSLSDEEADVFTMTSLSALVFLSQRESRTGMERNVEDIENEETRLSLAYERLHSMPKTLSERFSPYIQILDISHNEFENLDFLSQFKCLTTLICDHNNITSSTVIPPMPSLQILWMNHCKIGQLYPWARKLHQSCANVKQLSLMGNTAAPSYLNGGTFYEYLQYRLFMISLFTKLEYLDDRAVTFEQREEACRMYRRPLLERISTKTIENVPIYLRNVTDKVSDLFQSGIPFTQPKARNIIV